MRGASALTEDSIGTDDCSFTLSLRAYVDAVTHALGVGPESATIDTAPPASAYIALDRRLRAFPDRDLALLWDEKHGWSAAVETHSGEDLVIVAYLGAEAGLVPTPSIVARFAADSVPPEGQPHPPDLLVDNRHQLGVLLSRYRHRAT